MNSESAGIDERDGEAASSELCASGGNIEEGFVMHDDLPEVNEAGVENVSTMDEGGEDPNDAQNDETASVHEEASGYSRNQFREFEATLMEEAIPNMNQSAQQAWKRKQGSIQLKGSEAASLYNAWAKYWGQKYGFPYQDKERRRLLLASMMLSLKVAPAATEGESGPVTFHAEDTTREVSPRAERYAGIARRLRIDLEHSTNRDGWLDYWRMRLQQDPLVFGGSRNIDSRTLKNLLQSEQWVLRRAEAMYALATRLSDIDEREDYSEEDRAGRQTVFVDEATGETYVAGPEGQRFPIAIDEIGIDLDWGNRYRPDDGVTDELWRKIRKRSDIAEARHLIEAIDNEELTKIEHLYRSTTAIPGEWIEEHFESVGSGFAGLVAERMAKNALKRRTLRNPELGFSVEDSNAVEDMVLKYDFSIVRRNRRGVATEPEGLSREEYVDEKRKLGVQFTVTGDPSKINKKIRQIKKAKRIANSERMQKHTKSRVEDIVLVALRLDASLRYQRWLDEGKPPGGPERYMDDAEIEDLIARVTSGMPALGSDDREKTEVSEMSEESISSAVEEGESDEDSRAVELEGGETESNSIGAL